jgi:hypothetical protein
MTAEAPSEISLCQMGYAEWNGRDEAARAKYNLTAITTRRPL